MVEWGVGGGGCRVSTSNTKFSMKYSLFHFQWWGGGSPPQTQSLSSGFYSCKDQNSGKTFLLHVQMLYITDGLGVETKNVYSQSKRFLDPVYAKCLPYCIAKHFYCLGFKHIFILTEYRKYTQRWMVTFFARSLVHPISFLKPNASYSQ